MFVKACISTGSHQTPQDGIPLNISVSGCGAVSEITTPIYTRQITYSHAGIVLNPIIPQYLSTKATFSPLVQCPTTFLFHAFEEYVEGTL